MQAMTGWNGMDSNSLDSNSRSTLFQYFVLDGDLSWVMAESDGFFSAEWLGSAKLQKFEAAYQQYKDTLFDIQIVHKQGLDQGTMQKMYEFDSAEP